MVAMTPLTTGEAFGMWILTGVLARHPRLKLVFVEPGLAWVAWWLHVVDDMVLRQGYEFPGLIELPSFDFHQNVHLTFIEEDFSLDLLRDRIGVRNIMWSSDYPHPVTSWPHSREVVEAQFHSIPPDERETDSLRKRRPRVEPLRLRPKGSSGMIAHTRWEECSRVGRPRPTKRRTRPAARSGRRR